MRNKPTEPNRRGITLLFVVSMIVLFLLMGTAFVVVAGDFLRGSKKRARVDLHTIDATANVELGLYDLLRGPTLDNANSPLRAADLLSDMYGYGFKAYVDSVDPPVFVPGTGNQLFQLVLRSAPAPGGLPNQALDLLNPAAAPIPLTPYPGIYNGLVLSFVSGTEQGVSTRILRHEINMAGDHTFWLSVLEIRGVPLVNAAYLNSLQNSEVVVNGREFSGRGAGVFNIAAAPGTAALDVAAMQPNRKGETLAALKTNYLPSSLSPNEPHDAADYHNMFLAGIAADGTLIPSFHRPRLATFFGNGLATSRHMFSAFDNAPLTVDSNNDGISDSFWMDIGATVSSDGNGLYYKPLFAFTIVDLDGRLNLNAHGNLVDADVNNFIALPRISTLGGESALTLPRGQGWGPAEISLTSIFGNVDYNAVLASRYGPDGVPGTPIGFSASRSKLFGHPFARVDWVNNLHGTVGNLFASSPMDLHGRFALGTPLLASVVAANPKDRFVDRNISGFPTGMPIMDMLYSGFAGEEFTNSPYGMSFAPIPFNGNVDRPFSEAELERVLRPYDVDSNILPSRLWNAPATAGFWTSNPTFRDLVTTASFEVPVTYESFEAKLINKVANVLGISLASPTAAEIGLINARIAILKNDLLFAPELFAGLKMNVNRPLGNGYDGRDVDLIVDNPGEEATEGNFDRGAGVLMDLNNDGIANNAADSNVRTDFAKQLYCLGLLSCNETDFDEDGDGTVDAGSFKRAVAQWAINTVDFRDPDTIMTRFAFDVNPWDGWAPLPADFVWGCERPELLLSETWAAHARRSEDLTAHPDFEQGLRPEPFAFVELYNPWTQNSLNQQFDSSLYDAATQGVALAQRSLAANGTPTPVWRISVDRPNRGAANPNLNTTPVRYVYFTNPDSGGTDMIGDDNSANVEVFFSSFAGKSVPPGSQALVGSLGIEDPSNAGHYRSYLGRLLGKTIADEIANSLQLDTTRHIEIDPANGEVVRFPIDAVANPRYASIVPVDRARIGTPLSPANPRPFAVSDPTGGYPVVDAMLPVPTPYAPVPDGYRYTTPYDDPLDVSPPMAGDFNRDLADMNAVLVERGMSQNFRVIRLQRLANPLNAWDANLNPYITIDTVEMDLVAFNGVTADPEPTTVAGPFPLRANSVERGTEAPAAATNRRILWNSGRSAISAGTPGAGDHYFNVELKESLAKTNNLFTDPNAVAEGKGFPGLNWNNRPFVSHLELVNVPYSTPGRLTQQFTIDDGTVNPYTGVANRLNGGFGHLFNFFASDIGGGGPPTKPDLYRVMEFLEVPSRFLGTESNMVSVGNFVQDPFNFLSRYRVPGKINLNTIYSEQVYRGLMGNYATLPGGCSWAEFVASRNGTSAGTDFDNPFRPAGTGNHVATGTRVVEGPNCTVFREGAVAGEPLFDFSSSSATNDTDRSAYFRNAMRQRLANLTTTRSSVFAIWITVGYFEVDASGALKPGTGNGVELGADIGRTKRNRGFFIFDRSIPVAFEPGKNHNIDRAILVRSIIE